MASHGKHNVSDASTPYQDLLEHPEKHFQAVDILWMMVASAMVFIMIPAISLVYAGAGNRTYALTMFRLPLITAAVVGLEWYFWGYALAFTRSGLSPSWWGSEEARAGTFVDIVARPIATGDGGNGRPIPELVYVLFEGMFACFTATLVCGGAMHRARPARFLAFISLWLVVIYSPVARWSWDRDGWSHKLGVMDFAGGTPVHIIGGSTVAGFAFFYAIERRGSMIATVAEGAWRLSERLRHWYGEIVGWLKLPLLFCLEDEDGVVAPAPDYGLQDLPSEPYSHNYLVLGTALLWFGWAGFNGGSALGANLRAASAWLATHVAACAGGVTGLAWSWLSKLVELLRRKEAAATAEQQGKVSVGVESEDSLETLSVVYFCDGAIAGLVAITPGAGYVAVRSAAIFGVVASIAVHALKKETSIFLQYDQLQIFAVHAGAGVIGMLLTGLLADETTIGLDGHSQLPFPDRSQGERFGLQLADATAGFAYTFMATVAILYLMKVVAFAANRVSGGSIRWRDASGYYGQAILHDEFQATEMQQWRSQREASATGRPGLTAGSAVPELSVTQWDSGAASGPVGGSAAALVEPGEARRSQLSSEAGRAFASGSSRSGDAA